MDALDRLATTYAAARGTEKAPCPVCHDRPVNARLVVQVKRNRPREGRKTDETVVSATRSMCGECTAEKFAAFLEQLPEPNHRGGQPGARRA